LTPSLLKGPNMEVKQSWETLESCFVVDFTQPYFVKLHAPIFELDKDDVAITNESQAEMVMTQVSSDEDTSNEFSASVSLKARYGCFSGSASMGVDKSKSMSKHTMRTDVKVTASKYAVSGIAEFLLDPHLFLTAFLKGRIAEGLTMEELEMVIGHFYCSQCRLGGIFQKSYIVEMSSKDNKLSMQASLKASYGAGLASCSAEASVGMKTSKHNKNASMRIEQECLGVDASIWLGATADNTDAIQAKWAASVNDDNLFALDMDLHFSWTLVEALNPAVGAQYKAHLQEKWAKQSATSKVETLVYVESGGKYAGQKVKVKSWTGDYLHRPDNAQGVTTHDTGIGNEWTVEQMDDGKIMLKSWKGDYLHRPDNSGGVTSWGKGGKGDIWTIEELDSGKGEGKFPSSAELVSFKSWKGDHLHRSNGDGNATSYTKHGIGNVWTIEIMA